MASHCCNHSATPFHQKLRKAAHADFENAIDKLSRTTDILQKTTDNLSSLISILERTYVVAESDSTDPPIDLTLSPHFKMKAEDLINRKDLRTGPLTSQHYYDDMKYFSTQLNEFTRKSLVENKKGFIITYVQAESLELENHSDTNSALVLGNSTSKVISSALDDKLYLDDFFKRPVLIDVRNLTLNSNIDYVLNPYDIWSRLPSVRNKLAHYSYFRGNLKLRFSISSSKFHYGSLLVSHQPLSSTNRNYLVHKGLSPLTEQKRQFRQNYLSQSPTLCYVNPGQDDDVQLDIPFISPQNSLRLYDQDSASVLGNIDGYPDFSSMGEIFITSLGQFHSQSPTDTSTLSLTIYGWMEDVELSTPTNTRITVTAESEFLTNPISSTATAISNIAEKLSDVPVISTFAKATQIAATAIAQIALMFGFSKPTNVSPPSFAKQVTFSNGATIIGRDTAFKLTCDPKQELALMNDIMGSGSHDPLAHKYITSIPSLLNTFQFNGVAVPYQTNLLVIPITPMLGTHFVNTSSTVTRQLMMNSALSQVAMNYTYWRGTVSFRFDVIASNFTRGKLMFIYEPNATDSFVDRKDRPTILNQQYITTLDLEKERSITIHVGYNSHRNFAQVHQSNNAKGGLRPYFNLAGDTTNEIITSNLRGQSTGVLTVRPSTTITELTASTAPMYINTYVYSNDMEFCEPWDHVNSSLNSNINAESAYEQGEPINKVQMQDDHVVNVTGVTTTINRMSPNNKNLFNAHFGEKIESLRVLLKRDQSAFSLTHTNTNTVEHPLYPPHNNFLIPRSVTITSNNGRVNTFNILRYCYLGVRGGVRYRLSTRSDNFIGNIYTKYKRTRLFIPTLSARSITDTIVAPSVSGSIVQNPAHGGVEYEIPYFSTSLFDSPGVVGFYDIFDRFEDSPGAIVYTDVNGAAPAQIYQMSIAEDFNFLRFQGSCFYSIDPVTNIIGFP
jgi:hypothetical protein